MIVAELSYFTDSSRSGSEIFSIRLCYVLIQNLPSHFAKCEGSAVRQMKEIDIDGNYNDYGCIVTMKSSPEEKIRLRVQRDFYAEPMIF